MLEQLEELLNRDPFAPFRVVLTSGSTYDVTSPYQLVLGTKGAIEFFYARSTLQARLRPNQIAAIEDLELTNPS